MHAKQSPLTWILTLGFAIAAGNTAVAGDTTAENCGFSIYGQTTEDGAAHLYWVGGCATTESTKPLTADENEIGEHVAKCNGTRGAWKDEQIILFSVQPAEAAAPYPNDAPPVGSETHNVLRTMADWGPGALNAPSGAMGTEKTSNLTRQLVLLTDVSEIGSDIQRFSTMYAQNFRGTGPVPSELIAALKAGTSALRVTQIQLAHDARSAAWILEQTSRILSRIH